jgi:large subunit ribosomal protein L3
MIPGMLGKKLGMTQVFDVDGLRIPVTVMEVGPCQVQAVMVGEKDGYNAVQIGYGDTTEKRINKPQREYLKSRKLTPKKFVREIRCEEAPEAKIGDELTNCIFQVGDHLDVTGLSKGKGFQGGMKRCGWSGGKDTHGSMSHRAPGSIGQSSYPSRVFKGMGMAGQMGNKQKTVQHLEVVDVNTGNNTVAVKGAVPGANGTYLIIRYSKKKPLAARVKAEAAAGEGKEETQEGSAE